MSQTAFDKKPLVLYQNYDYGAPDPNGPGTGLYADMQKVKSVAEFRRKKNKKKIKKRQAALIQMLISQADEDKNNLTDPYEGQITPIPFNPAEPNTIGILDSMLPQLTDEEGNYVSNLYYGTREDHYFANTPDIKIDEKDPKSEPSANNSASSHPKKSAK